MSTPTLRLELQMLAENETCSAVTRIDWPTRQNDMNCSLRALAICANPGCEAPLCALHLEICRQCAKEFCEGCYEDHISTGCGKTL